MSRRPAAIWQVPLSILAGATAIAGLGFGIAALAMPAPWGMVISYALAGASLTFTATRVIHTGAVTRRELELVVLACGIFIAPFFVIGGASILAIGLGVLIFDETQRVFQRGVDAILGTGASPAPAPPAHEADPEDIEAP